MRFCSECGHGVALRWVAADHRMRLVCDDCGTTHYENPRIVVGCFVSWREQLLLCRRALAPARGLWTVPSGYLECGESLAEAAARETLEETGVVITADALELSCVVNLPTICQVLVFFRAELVGERPVLHRGPESLEVALFPETNLPTDQLAWPDTMGDSPQRFLREMRSGDFKIRIADVSPERGAYRLKEHALR